MAKIAKIITKLKKRKLFGYFKNTKFKKNVLVFLGSEYDDNFWAIY